MLAPFNVPIVNAPFRENFMLLIPDASYPAVEICSDRSAAGIDPLSLLNVVVGQKYYFKEIASAM